jgi:lysophospholipase L1-like esterase
VELGDSWTFGEGASDPATTGYAGIVYESNRTAIDCLPAQTEQAADGCLELQRAIYARKGTAENPGVTTDRLINEQLAQATSLIGQRNGDSNPRNDVEVILLSVGGNDVSGPVLQACLGGLTAACISVISERIGHVNENLDVILGSIRGAAGTETRIVITTYDNAIAHCPLGSVPGAIQLGALVLEGNPALGITGLNEVIRARAAEHGVAVADTFGRLGAGRWVGDCLHPNDAGHAVIGEIAAEAAQS